MTNYVSAVPLKELGLGLGVEHVGDEQAQELTDDYSLPALKVTRRSETAKGQRSDPTNIATEPHTHASQSLQQA